MGIYEVAVATIFVGVVVGLFTYVTYMTFYTAVGTQQRIKERRRRKHLEHITRDPYREALRNIERLEHELELGDDK